MIIHNSRPDPFRVIGHDLGTGGCKTVLAEAGGEVLASCFTTYDVSYPGPGRAEQDPHDWWAAVTAGTREVLSGAAVAPGDVSGIGFAGQMISIVPVDTDGVPARPAIIWLDSRADEQARRMIRRMGGRRVVLAVAGALPSGKDIVAKIAWLRENEPDVWERTHRFLDATGYLVMRSTGRMVIDHTGAGGTGLLNRRREWSGFLARMAGTPLDRMPPIVGCTDIVGGLTADAAAEMGLREGTPVIAGMSDIPAAATGSGALEDGDAHIYLGSSSWLCISVRKPRNLGGNGIAAVASPDPEMSMMIGESETAGMCLEWFEKEFATPEERERAAGVGSIYRVLDGVAERVEAGSRGLVFTPWLFGERSPVADTTLRGAFVNLSLDHSREHMLRAVYEGVAYNIRWLLDAAAGAGLGCDPVRAIGGGAKSDLWLQVISDVTERRVEAVERPQDAGAVGCALGVAAALGVFGRYSDIKRAVRVRKTFEPGSENRRVYDRLYAGYRRLYPGLSEVCRALNTAARVRKGA